MKEIDIHKIRSRDHDEIIHLSEQVSTLIYSLVLSYVHNLHDAQEIVQDTIIKAIDESNNFNQDSSLKTWIYRIAINKSKDLLKYKKRQKRTGKTFSIDDDMVGSNLLISTGTYYHPDLSMESNEQLKILYKGINQLPGLQKQALTLFKLESLSTQEVATVLNITAKAVEGLISRSKKNLKAFLEAEGFTTY